MGNPWQRREVAAKIESEGARVVVPAYPEWAFIVRRRCAWNRDYQSAIARIAARPEVAALMAKQRANPDAELSEAERNIDAGMMREAFAVGCLGGWNGVTDATGKPLAFQAGNVVKVLEAFPDIEAELNAASVDPSRFGAPSPAELEALARGN